MILSSQIQAARTLLCWTQKELSEKSGVGLPTLKRIEGGGSEPVKASTGNLWKVQSALEAAGIVFIVADDDGGAGVRLKK